MRVDAMLGEAEGEDEKTLMIQSLRAMVDGLKRQVLSSTLAPASISNNTPAPAPHELGRAAARRTAPKLPRAIRAGPNEGGKKWGI